MPTTFLRFFHLNARNIVKNWPDLKSKVENEMFPPGRHLGVNTRVWTEEEIETHLSALKLADEGATAADIMAATGITDSDLAAAYVELGEKRRRKREAAAQRARLGRRRRPSNEETHAA